MISPGKILYQLYHRPKDVISKTLRIGVSKTLAIKRGMQEMEEASQWLREVIYPAAPTYQIYFLTGKKYWYQTAFCLYSLQKQAGVNISAVVVDDGSFDDALLQQAQKQFPTTVTVIRKEFLRSLLDQHLPESTFTVLRQRRLEYPHLRKLTDIHILESNGPKLVLDSDMLFFQRPAEILNWLQQPDGCLFMKDVEESYGYSTELMCELTGAGMMPEKLNVGVAGIDSAAIDWHQLEYWTKTMLEREGSSYLQEQALTAMLAASKAFRLLDTTSYKVLPTISSKQVPEILHHYVADSKYDYFVKGWKLVNASRN